MNENYNIEEIEVALAEAVIQKNVSKIVYQGHQANKLSEDVSDFVVVLVSSNLRDLNTYGRCICQIQLFAKNLSNGQKNTKKLSLLYKKLCTVFPIRHDTYIFLPKPTIIPLGNDKNGYTVHAIQIETLIKAV